MRLLRSAVAAALLVCLCPGVAAADSAPGQNTCEKLGGVYEPLRGGYFCSGATVATEKDLKKITKECQKAGGGLIGVDAPDPTTRVTYTCRFGL